MSEEANPQAGQTEMAIEQSEHAIPHRRGWFFLPSSTIVCVLCLWVVFPAHLASRFVSRPRIPSLNAKCLGKCAGIAKWPRWKGPQTQIAAALSGGKIKRILLWIL